MNRTSAFFGGASIETRDPYGFLYRPQRLLFSARSEVGEIVPQHAPLRVAVKRSSRMSKQADIFGFKNLRPPEYLWRTRIRRLTATRRGACCGTTTAKHEVPTNVSTLSYLWHLLCAEGSFTDRQQFAPPVYQRFDHGITHHKCRRQRDDFRQLLMRRSQVLRFTGVRHL